MHICPMRKEEGLRPDTGPFDNMGPRACGVNPIPHPRLWPQARVYVGVSVFLCVFVLHCLGFVVGEGHGAGKGLHCHSGIKFNFIFVHIFCQVRRVLASSSRPRVLFPKLRVL